MHAAATERERIAQFFSLLVRRYEDLRAAEEAARHSAEQAQAARVAEPRHEEIPLVDPTRNLMDDVLTLFTLGDLDGGLISLERLLFLFPDNDRVRRFISKYHDRILKLYEDVYTRSDVALEFGPSTTADKFGMLDEYAPLNEVRELVRRSRDGRVSSIIEASPHDRLITLALVNFLTRSGVLRVHQA
jgi:hypothetical protein